LKICLFVLIGFTKVTDGHIDFNVTILFNVK